MPAGNVDAAHVALLRLTLASPASWQVDRHSPAYYSFSARPSVKTALDKGRTPTPPPAAAATADAGAASTDAAAAGNADADEQRRSAAPGSAAAPLTVVEGSPPPVGPGRQRIRVR